ncbi:hypothetical protein L4C34_03545 [Vibrio profundum]|uniref:hypothetical protein n=1 Tax=Vibrio profundum TaxID=2910247 RepID=UPI003D1508B2
MAKMRENLFFKLKNLVKGEISLFSQVHLEDIKETKLLVRDIVYYKVLPIVSDTLGGTTGLNVENLSKEVTSTLFEIKEDPDLISHSSPIIEHVVSQCVGKSWLDYSVSITSTLNNHLDILSDNLKVDRNEYLAIKKRVTSMLNIARSESVNVEFNISRAIGSVTKFKFGAAEISSIIAFLSAMFIFSGYIYEKIFFLSFNVDVEDFYTIQDYLSSSLGAISSSFLYTVVPLVSVCFIYLMDSNSPSFHTLERFLSRKSRPVYYFIFLLFISYLILIATIDRYYELQMYIGWVAILFLFLKYLFSKYLGEVRSVIFLTLFAFILYVSSVFLVAKQNVDSAINSKDEKYSIILKSGYKAYKAYRYLSSNSNFIFMLSNKDNAIVILPKDSIMSLKSVY